MTERVIESFDGTSIWFTDTEIDGPVVVLLHGAGMTSITNFDTHYGPDEAGRIGPGSGPTIASSLRDQSARVVAVDARGHGRSGRSADPDRYGGDAHARDVEAVLDAVAVDQVDLVGYSMGSFTAAPIAQPRVPPSSGGIVWHRPAIRPGGCGTVLRLFLRPRPLFHVERLGCAPRRQTIPGIRTPRPSPRLHLNRCRHDWPLSGSWRVPRFARGQPELRVDSSNTAIIDAFALRPESLRVELTFRDVAGAWWRRSTTGVLESIAAP